MRIVGRGRYLLLLSLGLVTGCGNVPASAIPANDSGQSTAVVQTGDISSIVSLDATVVSRPSFVIAAQATGSVHLLTPPVAPGSGSVVVARIEGPKGTVDVDLPAYAGFVAWLVRDGDPVTAGSPILSAYYSGFALQATIPDDSLYRFYGTIGAIQGQIYHGPGPFTCPELGSLGSNAVGPGIAPVGTAQPASGQGNTPTAATTTGPAGTLSPDSTAAQAMGQSEASGQVTLLCSLPRDLSFFAGMTGVMAVATGEAHGVLTLPVEAVAGSSQSGQVTLVHADGSTETVDVQLGITDGVRIEIKSGLQAGDRVAVPGPFLPGARP